VTGVGGDGLGDFVRARLTGHGVDVRYVQVAPDALTPLALVALDPPSTPQVAFYRGEAPPDGRLEPDLLPESVLDSARALWVSHAALAGGSTSRSLTAWLGRRRRARYTLLDLDHRPALWSGPAEARRAAEEAIRWCDVVVGNREECAMALGTDDADRGADALLAVGVDLAVVKLGADGVLMATPHRRLRISTRPVEVVCGLGAGDAFGGALVHGLLAGHDLERIGRTACDAGSFVTGRLTCSDDMPTGADLAAISPGPPRCPS
jgi:5-dehydro-2-deoxygluconokinase